MRAEPAAEPSTPRPLSLRANFSWTVVGNFTYALCQWGMVTLLVKVSNPEVVGQLTYGLALTAPIFMLSNLQLRGLQATETAGVLRFADFAGVRAATTALAMAFTLGLVAFGGYEAVVAWTIFAMAFSRGAESAADLIHGHLMRAERMDLVSRSMILRALISVGALAATFAATKSLGLAVAAMAAGTIGVLLAYDLPCLFRVREPGERLRPRFETARVRKILADAVPLGAVMMLISLNTNVPRYFIESALGAYMLGIFAPLAQLVAAGYLVVNALGQSATPRLARLHASGDLPAFRRLLAKMLAMALGLTALGFALSKWIGAWVLTILYSAEYAAYVDLLLLFMVVAGLQFCGSFLGYGMTAARRYRVQLPLFVVVTAACVVACWALIPAFGLRGAVWALIVSALVQLAGSALVLWQALRPGSGPAPAPEG
ncbi:MAG TPA: lipopolysaccharide biosynthesis protein [Vulgatibacter sp.]|nr:lipopolysaccharide biosynthesis protein [Vulgatibacter sp.]